MLEGDEGERSSMLSLLASCTASIFALFVAPWNMQIIIIIIIIIIIAESIFWRASK